MELKFVKEVKLYEVSVLLIVLNGIEITYYNRDNKNDSLLIVLNGIEIQ